MPYRPHYPYDEMGPEEYRDAPPRSVPGQTTPPEPEPRTPEEHRAAAESYRRSAAMRAEAAARYRARGDGYRVWARSEEAGQARFEALAAKHEEAASRG